MQLIQKPFNTQLNTLVAAALCSQSKEYATEQFLQLAELQMHQSGGVDFFAACAALKRKLMAYTAVEGDAVYAAVDAYFEFEEIPVIGGVVLKDLDALFARVKADFF